MVQRKSRVMNKHTWTRIPHHNLDFFFHVRFIAVNNAFAAGAFLVLKWTFVKAHKCVFLELSAFLAYFAMGAVVVFAVDFNHVSNGFLFAFHSFMFRVWWLWLHIIPSSLNCVGTDSNKTLP